MVHSAKYWTGSQLWCVKITNDDTSKLITFMLVTLKCKFIAQVWTSIHVKLFYETMILIVAFSNRWTNVVWIFHEKNAALQLILYTFRQLFRFEHWCFSSSAIKWEVTLKNKSCLYLVCKQKNLPLFHVLTHAIKSFSAIKSTYFIDRLKIDGTGRDCIFNTLVAHLTKSDLRHHWNNLVWIEYSSFV